ncbi:MAG: MoxR family ATPase [Clostridia bacterium]|nr:MoxR family ATPase [Clostridia bacterium]
MFSDTDINPIASAIINEVKKVICGKDNIIFMVLVGILGEGHILIEDVPGVGKTTLALAFSRVMGLNYGRVQFTPDVLPSDITGFSIYDNKTGTMRYQQGSVFHNLFLADELNRASSRTQSALLEAMEEGQVTVDDATYLLPNPFIVFATQNPSGASGTSLLPDSQMDRFAVRISMGYPDAEAEKAMILARQNVNPLNDLRQVCSVEDILNMQNDIRNVYIDDKLIKYIINLVTTTRRHVSLDRGASPRATLALTDMAKACAYIHGRNYVIPQDVRRVFINVIAHRIILSPEADIKEMTTEEIANEIINKVAPPKV